MTVACYDEQRSMNSMSTYHWFIDSYRSLERFFDLSATWVLQGTRMA